MIDIKSFSKPKKSGNGSGGGSSSVTYISGIASEADHATRADKAKKAEVAEQANVANRATSAQTASYASKAGEVDIESETLQKFFRKDEPAEGEENVAEEVRRKVDFKKAATFEQSAVFKEAADMLKKFTAHELAAFLKGFTIAGQFRIDEYGDMILNTIKSLEYNNAAEQGFSIEKEDPNRDEYHQYITNLTVWGKMTMNELEVMKRTYAGGTIYLSPAGGKIAKVVPVYWDDEKSGWKETASDAAAVGWKCYLLADDGTAATENLWREGDQVRCQTMGRIAAGGIGQGSAANKSYWRTILEHGVSQQNEKIYDQEDHELFGGQRFAWIVIGKHSVQLDEYAEENAPAETRDIPEEGDVIVLDGSRTDPDRQNVFLLESHGSYAPRLVGYHGIDSYSHANKDVCDVSPKGVQVRSEYFKLLAQGSNTSTVEIPNFRGAWNAATQYYKNDQVSHNNAIWTCLSANNGTEPTDGSRYWRKEVYGMKGDKGNPGADGTDGIDGTNGEDAISIIVEDAPLIFDTGSNGIVPSNIAKSAKVKVMKGNVNVTNAITAASSNDEISVNCKSGVTMRQDSNDPFLNVDISGKNIGTTWLDENDHSKGVVSVTSGYATGSFAYNNKAYKFHVPFEVNVSKFTGQLILTTDKFSTEMSELIGKHNTLSDNYDRLADDLKTSSPSILTNYTSQIEQTARQISLTVSEKAMGRRNMLPGSALRKVGEGVRFEGNGYVSLFDNYLGTNSYVGKSNAKNTYVGLHWIGASVSQSVRVQKGHTYTLSCWIKADSTSIPFVMEAIWQASASDYTRPAGYAGPGNAGSGFQISESVNKVNIWQLITTTFTIPSDASYEYLEIYLFFRSNDDGRYNVAMSRPMMEEGNEYSGIWSLSEKDFDYIGGNLLDNTATFANDDNDNVNFVNKVIENGYEGKYNVAYAKNEKKDTYTEIAKWGTQSGNLSLTYGTDYVFSFLAKGTGRITCYMYKDGTPFIYTDNKETGGSYMSDGAINFDLEPTWRIFYVHWRVASTNLPTDVLIRAANITEAWIAKPKLEVGCTMTDWTEKRTDMVDRQALLATGIDITNGKITITANNTIFRDNNGTTIALFANGKINASLIDADQIEVKHLWAKSNDGASKVGYFGNTEEDACKIGDYTVAPLFIGGATAKESPFYVTSKGAMHATSGKIGYFTISPNGELMYDDGYTDVAHRPFGLSKEALYFTHTTRDHKSNDAIVWVGRTNFSESSTGTVGLLSDIWIDERVSTPTQSKACLFLSAEGYTGEDTDYKGDLMGNFAIYAKKGAYAGFRPAVRIAIENCQLTDMDCVIYVSVTGVYLTLPDNPQKGQYYKFIQGAGEFHIKSSSKNIYNNINGVTNDFTSASYNQTTEMIWLGDHWRVNWFREIVGK